MASPTYHHRLIGSLTGLLLASSLAFTDGTAPAPVQSGPLAIHGHPQKSVYLSPDEWPEIDGQCHWSPAVDPSVPSLGHLHVGLKVPMYAELDRPFTVPVTLQMFRLQGKLDIGRFPGHGGVSGQGITGLVWDATGTSMPPAVDGDPNGLVVMTGRLTVDPSLSAQTPDRGWAPMEAASRVYLANGDIITTRTRYTIYSMRDASATESFRSISEEQISTYCAYSTARSLHNGIMGNVIAGLGTANRDGSRDMIPLAPLSAPWPLTGFGYTYGGTSLTRSLPLGFNEIRLNPSLHHGHDGTLLAGPMPPSRIPFTIDPSQLGDGLHTLMYRWHQDSGAGAPEYEGGLIAESLLVVKIPVGDAPPPPPPPDPCSVSLSVTVTQWPGAQAGTHGWRYTSSHDLTLVTADFQQLTALDVCGRSVTVRR